MEADRRDAALSPRDGAAMPWTARALLMLLVPLLAESSFRWQEQIAHRRAKEKSK
jgi:hypothetical protein